VSDSRSVESAEYRKLYKTARWRRLREAQLSAHPLCERCLAQDIVEPATVVHHADGGHKGDVDKFWGGPFESLCKPHHDSHGQLEDHGKTVITFGPDGYPI
jgi:5-methylcytosine-specific restriction enzyme A